jgi:hypothetical protein
MCSGFLQVANPPVFGGAEQLALFSDEEAKLGCENKNLVCRASDFEQIGRKSKTYMQRGGAHRSQACFVEAPYFDSLSYLLPLPQASEMYFTLDTLRT